MGQAGRFLRRAAAGYVHWCPACEDVHGLPDGWAFNGDLERPTFLPSFKHTLHRFRGGLTPEGLGIGPRYDHICHYMLTAGMLQFCGDCTHALAGQTVALPPLPPPHLMD
jgi:hypothetical protein